MQYANLAMTSTNLVAFWTWSMKELSQFTVEDLQRLFRISLPATPELDYTPKTGNAYSLDWIKSTNVTEYVRFDECRCPAAVYHWCLRPETKLPSVRKTFPL